MDLENFQIEPWPRDDAEALQQARSQMLDWVVQIESEHLTCERDECHDDDDITGTTIESLFDSPSGNQPSPPRP